MKLRDRIDFAYRVFGSALSFASFGIGALFLSGLIFPIVNFFSSSEKQKHGRINYLIHKSFQWHLRLMKLCRVFRFRFQGLEKIPEDSGCMVVANHPTLIDIVVFISLYPNATCIVKKALLKNFFIRGVIQGAGYIPNDENENMLNLCRDALNNGRTLIIFPEGTRTEPGKPINIKRGASQIAVRLGIPVRVAQIQVSGSMLTKSHSWYQLTPKLSEFNLVIGEKIEAGNSVYTSMPPSLAARHMTRRINEVLVKASSLDTNICLGYKSDNG